MSLSIQWAVQGTLLVWVGCRRGRMLPIAGGMVLQALAGGWFAVRLGESLPHGSDVLAVANQYLLVAVVLAVAGLVSGWRAHLASERVGIDAAVGWLALAWGAVWWLTGGLVEIGSQIPDYWLPASLVFVVASFGGRGGRGRSAAMAPPQRAGIVDPAGAGGRAGRLALHSGPSPRRFRMGRLAGVSGGLLRLPASARGGVGEAGRPMARRSARRSASPRHGPRAGAARGVAAHRRLLDSGRDRRDGGPLADRSGRRGRVAAGCNDSRRRVAGGHTDGGSTLAGVAVRHALADVHAGRQRPAASGTRSGGVRRGGCLRRRPVAAAVPAGGEPAGRSGWDAVGGVARVEEARGGAVGPSVPGSGRCSLVADAVRAGE